VTAEEQDKWFCRQVVALEAIAMALERAYPSPHRSLEKVIPAGPDHLTRASLSTLAAWEREANDPLSAIR
jgi:hypothetical protein